MKEDQRWVSKVYKGGAAPSVLLGAPSSSAYGFHFKIQGMYEV